MTYKSIDIRNSGKYEVNSGAIAHLPIPTDMIVTTNSDFINNGTITFPNTTTTLELPITKIHNNGTIAEVENLIITGGTNLYHDANGSLDILENLIISNGSTVELSNYSLNTSLSLNNLTIQNGGILTHTQNDATQANILNLNVNNLTIDAGGEINLDGKGYSAEQGPGAGTGSSGGGYGGIGGAGNTGTPGSSYGQETNPIDIGSGGGNAGGRGGGMLKAQVNNNLVINGEITAKGQNALNSDRGGGAGGSVLLTAENFNGTGHINANGGEDSGVGGGGAGGRIAAFYVNEAFISGGGSISTLGNLEDPYGGTNGARGTLYLAYPDHYQIAGNNIQTAGTSQAINVSLIDNHGNPFIWSGDKNFIFSGANQSTAGDIYPNGTYPTCSDKNGNNINFGTATTLTLTNGIATSTMFLYKAETAEIETTDNTYNTFGNQSYDLDINVSSNTLDQTQTSLNASPNPVVVNNPVTITVTGKDIWGNAVTTGGDVITLTVSGANSANPAVTDNGDGTYTASYTPTVAGEDTIVGTVNGNVIQHDEDGTSDGTFHELVSSGFATHLEVTGNTSQEAGTVQTITITAKDSGGNTDFSYLGDKNITISGANPSLDGTQPTCRDKNGVDISLANPTNLTFNNGIATCQLYLYNRESAELDATDGTINSTGNANWDLNVDVSATSVDYNESIISASPSAVVVNNSTTITVTTRDEYQNQLNSGGSTVIMNITGNNSATPAVTDNGDGTYTATHTPTAVGMDLITGVVDANNIAHDSDGTDDGTYHLTVNAANNPPTDITLSSNTIDENQVINTVIGTLSTTDADGGDSHSYSLGCTVAGADDGSFNINSNELRSSSIFDYETKNSYNICLRTDDANGGTYDKNFVVTVNDLDEVNPIISEVTPVATPTNDNTPSYTFTTNEAGSITYGGDCSSSTVAASVGNNIVTFNLLTEGLHNNCTIRVTDSSGNLSNILAVSNFIIDTTPPVRSNGAPSGILMMGTTQATISLTTNENSTCKYDTNPGLGYAAMANTFTTTGAMAHSELVVGLTNGNTYNYYVRCTDNLNQNVDDYIISFSINSASNNPPTDITLSNSTFDENQPVNTTVGILSTTDADVGDTHTYAFNCGVPGIDDGSFNLDGNSLRSSAVFDYETKNSYNICLRTDDGNGGLLDKGFTITINDLDETVSPPEDAKDCKAIKVRDITTSSVILRGEVDKKYGGDKQKFKVVVVNKNTDEKKTLKLKARPSDQGKVSLLIDSLTDNTEYSFKLNFQGDDESRYSYCPHTKTAVTLKIPIGPEPPTEKPICGSNAKIYPATGGDFAGVFCQIGVALDTPNFPEPGETVYWGCFNDSNNVECVASREKEKITSPEEDAEEETEEKQEGEQEEGEDSPLMTKIISSSIANKIPADILVGLALFSGLVAALALAIPLAPIPLQASPLILFTLPFIKKSSQYGGVVFDYVTKQRLDKVLVILIDSETKRAVERTVTDQEGRYGFLISRDGKYELKIKRGAYTLKTNLEKDNLYGELYTKAMELKSGEIMEPNIALEQDVVDWQDYVKKTFSVGRNIWRRIWQAFSSLLLFLGVGITVYSVIKSPSIWNYLMLVIYILVIAKLIFGMVSKPRGVVKSKRDKKPLPFALVGLHKNGQRKYFSTTDIQGRYFLLAEEDNYNLKIRGKTLAGESVGVEKEIFAKNGVVEDKVEI
jgi:hypothetical protein